MPEIVTVNYEQLWQSALGELELSLSKANFTTWFKSTFILGVENAAAVIGVPNAFTKAWLENKYKEAITKALSEASNSEVTDVSFTITKNPSRAAAKEKEGVSSTEEQKAAGRDKGPSAILITKSSSFTEAETVGRGFNPSYTFETFIVGKGNELAVAAAQAVTNRLGTAYNPLFIYGGVGLGKTHLLQAIGSAIINHSSSYNGVLYVTCERFTNEFIDAVREGRSKDFKNVYRNVDVLLIDDIQFLVGKESTQEEFFHTFNQLHQNNKQVVISSDRPPKALPAIEQRLISRFEWGMIVDITAPDLETRMAILENKCRLKGVSLSKDILQFIASVVQNNVRELEGALNRIQAYHDLNGTEPTLESIKNILSSMVSAPKHGAITPKQLMSTISEYFDVSIENLIGASRKRDLVVPRQIAMYLMREEIRSSFPTIGHELGGRDHSTAMHAYTKISEEVKSNQRIEHDINLIRQRLYNHTG